MSKLFEKWRNDLYASGNFNHDELNELESHMMDEIEKLDTELLSEQEKVMIASNRLGSATTLNKAFENNRIFNFQRISIFGQVLLGIISFLTLARASLFLSLTIQKSIGWTDSLSLVTMYYTIQLISAVGFFMLIRHWIKMSIRQGKTIRASAYALFSVLGSLGLFLLILKFSDLSQIIRAPFFLSAFSTSLSVLFIIGFSVATVSVWFKRKRQLTAA